ncbi:hypothetical protein [Pseudobacteroides cellulosolvens]|uniref:Uncharacterized protein n=1 Tax=Pseudobacteroides cellulosolvens ATCC 35603 = DSM 2933 TaxID=398512 RepID=A0A0L6JWK0_9FIRM|nr:hypothetical protein [Pseudobacteroides cellulosolvens]KNY30213.1 hypothetical protein Bccel_5490 [Pseudobacteroides cellulosolvens ATCC 35603 = DSM 2933]
MHTKKILKVRPGHLANFSGGAGYMPMVVIFSVFITFISTIISNIIVYNVSKKISQGKIHDIEKQKKVELSSILLYTNWHIRICLVIALIEAIPLLIFGYSAIYSQDKVRYIFPAIMLSVGPVIGFLISTWVLIKMILTQGLKKFQTIISIGIYIAVTLLLTAIGWIQL